MAQGVVDGVVEERSHRHLSAGGLTASGVVDQVCAGSAELHRVASAQLGFTWLLMPLGRVLPDAIGEAAAADPRLVSDDGPVGRVVWIFRARKTGENNAEDS